MQNIMFEIVSQKGGGGNFKNESAKEVLLINTASDFFDEHCHITTKHVKCGKCRLLSKNG